jgi:hypothetical protein
MSLYTVQYGDTPMSISQKLSGSAARVGELVRSNAHKPTRRVGRVVTFQNLQVGERLTVPPRWRGPARPARRGVAGHAYPQPSPHFAVRPRAGGEGGGDDSGHGVEPILTVSGKPGAYRGVSTEGLGQSKTGAPCCARCGQTGGTCGGAGGVQQPACSAPQAQPSIPGSTSFPVGFGQVGLGQGPITTQYPAVAVVTSWGFPLAVAAASIAAGFGLAYIINKN